MPSTTTSALSSSVGLIQADFPGVILGTQFPTCRRCGHLSSPVHPVPDNRVFLTGLGPCSSSGQREQAAESLRCYACRLSPAKHDVNRSKQIYEFGPEQIGDSERTMVCRQANCV